MTYPMNAKHFESVIRLSPDERYSYAIKRVADWAELWVSENSPTESKSHVPIRIWPHSPFAEMYIAGSAKPVRVKIHDWLQSWVPVHERVHRPISVFPIGSSEKMVSAQRLKEDLAEELSKIED